MPEVLLTPLPINWKIDDNQSALLNSLGFDVSALSAKKSVVYAVPRVFQHYSFDLHLVLQCLE